MHSKFHCDASLRCKRAVTGIAEHLLAVFPVALRAIVTEYSDIQSLWANLYIACGARMYTIHSLVSLCNVVVVLEMTLTSR